MYVRFFIGFFYFEYEINVMMNLGIVEVLFKICF